MIAEEKDEEGVSSLRRDRLLSLIDFSQQAARLRSKPVATVTEHRQFALYEHECQGLPGIKLDRGGLDDGDETWLIVERLSERPPPEIASQELRPWVHITQGPAEVPRLHDSVDGESLIAAGVACSAKNPVIGKPVVGEDTVRLSDYEKRLVVESAFAVYRDRLWRPWAEEEKLRRKTIVLYSNLFRLKQQLDGGIVEAQLELLWGVGLGIWNTRGTAVSYPLVGRLVELSLNTITADIQIRPRDIEARIEVDWYAALDIPGVVNLEKAAKEFFGKATETFSPFDRGTFEPLLRTAAAYLDANGVYWPTVTMPENRTPPKADDKLKVTDTWVLFARPRTNSLFLQDLAALRKKAEEAPSYPPAVAALVTDPETSNPIVDLPVFRGVSSSDSSERSVLGGKVRDLYFPKAFNAEQVRIVQMLDVSDGVVVQGPPGTGKTHTIANVICHYLAEGKRVLVTSMKDPALSVLQAQLPEEIRPLAISLLTSEQEGMKQFEHAIQKIASEVQGLDRSATARDIRQLEELIDSFHGKLASTDRKIEEWAMRNLSKIRLDGQEIEPQDAAREVMEGTAHFEWIPDALGIDVEFAPQFSDLDIAMLREARRSLGKDISYLNSSLPQLVEFPDSKALLEVHQDQSRFERLKREVESGIIPPLADSTEETIARAHQVLLKIEDLKLKRGKVEEAARPWTKGMRQRLRRGRDDGLISILESLGAELELAVQDRKSFLERPVSVPAGLELDLETVAAVNNLGSGRRPFGLSGLFGKTRQKQQLESIRVVGRLPTEESEWRHVGEYLAFLGNMRELASRWNALTPELQFEVVAPGSPESCLVAAGSYSVYLEVKDLVKVEDELCLAAALIFPDWPHSREVASDPTRLVELEEALRHHLTKNRLANVWLAKERFQQVLVNRTGGIIAEIRRFLSEVLGNPEVEDARMQAGWSMLMGELSRTLGLSGHLATVRCVCEKIRESGALRYSIALQQQLEGEVDHLLPDSWRTSWRLRRMASYLESIDAHRELKRLAKERTDLDRDLSRSYRDIVVKRTWLKLAENASHSIRAALQAYLNAIQKIGKGTGKRALRYRKDARSAAAQANPAVPCWIMPHYRVSESLPAELGCFDLVIIDEASQSDLTALPSLLRAKKVLIVGDDKQISPEGVGLEEEKIRSLMGRFLASQVKAYGPQMAPDRSIYDLFKVVFAKSAVMLREHFRCVGPIIEYSKREFYNHELRPLRLPSASERLDPPLIDVVVEDGYRRGDVNLAEVRYILDEVIALVADPSIAGRSIGVVSLLGDKQALEVWERLTSEIGHELMQRHRIACGDARTFQGKERDIMFLSMVSAPNEVGAPLAQGTVAQRFNVAASRARDRMYLVRSVGLEHLSKADRYRRSLISHFAAPFAQDELKVRESRELCESGFESEVYDELTQRGFRVTPQVRVGHYRIDLVVEGNDDARLAIECDGDAYHGPERWADDLQRQRVLERAGWVFWRCFASAFIRRRKDMLDDLFKTLAERGIEPVGADGMPRSRYTERRSVPPRQTQANN